MKVLPLSLANVRQYPNFGVALYVQMRPYREFPTTIDGYVQADTKGLVSPEDCQDAVEDMVWYDHLMFDSFEEAQLALDLAIAECRLQHLHHQEAGGHYRPLVAEIVGLIPSPVAGHRRFVAENVLLCQEVTLKDWNKTPGKPQRTRVPRRQRFNMTTAVGVNHHVPLPCAQQDPAVQNRVTKVKRLLRRHALVPA